MAVALKTDVAIRRFAERDHNVTRWSEPEDGGNFLALEQPEAFVEDVRAFFASLGAWRGGGAGVRTRSRSDLPSEWNVF